MSSTFNICGSYEVGNSAFTSGRTNLLAYGTTIEHLKKVLINANPTGDHYWGGKGIVIHSWVHDGKSVDLSDPCVRTIQEFEAILRSIQ